MNPSAVTGWAVASVDPPSTTTSAQSGKSRERRVAIDLSGIALPRIDVGGPVDLGRIRVGVLTLIRHRY